MNTGVFFNALALELTVYRIFHSGQRNELCIFHSDEHFEADDRVDGDSLIGFKIQKATPCEG